MPASREELRETAEPLLYLIKFLRQGLTMLLRKTLNPWAQVWLPPWPPKSWDFAPHQLEKTFNQLHHTCLLPLFGTQHYGRELLSTRPQTAH